MNRNADIFGRKNTSEDKDNEKERLKELIQNELGFYIKNKRTFTMTSDEERNELKGYMNTIIYENPNPTFLRRAEINEFVNEYVLELTSLGILSGLLEDDEVSEIMVNGFDDIWVEKNGKLVKTDLSFKDPQELFDLGARIARNIGKTLDLKNTMVDARLPDGSRVNVVTYPNYLGGTSITIRKFSKQRLTIEDLIRGGTINKDMALFLNAAVLGEANILVSGGTNSGKTTTLNILSNFIPEEERVITIEDPSELQLNGKHVISLETTEANSEGEGEVTMTDLLKNALRMKPNRIIVGEVRDHTAYDLLNSMNTGHDGAMSTIHANNPKNCIVRLNSLISEKGFNYSLDTVHSMIGGAIDLIIQIKYDNGKRIITDISQTFLDDEGKFVIEQLFGFSTNIIDEDDSRRTGFKKNNETLSYDLQEKLRLKGIDPEEVF